MIIHELYLGANITETEKKNIEKKQKKRCDLLQFNQSNDSDINIIMIKYYRISKNSLLEWNKTLFHPFKPHMLPTRLRNNIIKLRRQIMIIHNFLFSAYTIHTDLDDVSQIYTNVMFIFGLLYNDYLIMLPKLSIINLHVSKAMGTSVCETFTHLQYATIHGHRCNYYPQGATPEGVKKWPIKCAQLESYAKFHNSGMLAQESPIGMHDNTSTNDNATPTLCPNFDYMLVFRDPIERAFSNFHEKSDFIYVQSRIDNSGSKSKKHSISEKKSKRKLKVQSKSKTTSTDRISINGI